MVDQLNAFASEVTRVAREVGSEGKLGGQAQVPGVAGTWKDLTDNVNWMASNLTGQVRNIAEVTTAVAKGDLSRKITVDVRGEILQLKETINTMVDQLNGFAAEVTRVAREVGTEGKLGGQAIVPGVAGTWKDLTDSVNAMATNLTSQVRNIAEVTTAVARGDLSRKITVDVRGEILQLKETVNTMVDQLNAFASEVTRVAREVGTEGKLGGQAQVKGVSGVWKDLTDNVNSMAGNLTSQVRNIAEVATAIADGDLSRTITVDVKGEILELKNTINTMVDQLNGFAAEVTRVAREVGTDGKLGGQAQVPGVAGTWKDLTDNVNLLAANLTTQVRAIAEVTTAVTKGDLTRSIQVHASGEVAELKDYINAMIGNLRVTTERNTEQDWLKTNLAKFGGMMQGQRDLLTVAQVLLSELAPLVGAQQGVMYVKDDEDGTPRLTQLAGYADRPVSGQPRQYRIGEGLVGQCVVERSRILLSDIPDDSIRIGSGLVEARPQNVIVLPVLFEGEVRAVIELASLGRFTASHLALLEQLTGSIGIVLNTIEATMRTEGLLRQSQELAAELQAQQKELQQTNEELGQKAQQLAAQNAEVERKNQEIDQARRAVEEKAGELALTSRYKSEFLANMSHELRTPLNSILILGQQLGDNADGNLTPKQIEFAKTIHGAGTDLLNLISDILDLSKIESGTVTVESEELPFSGLRETVERNFRHVAESRKLAFAADFDPRLGRVITTDSKRLLQVLKNLLSNAFKFTDHGGVRLEVAPADGGWGGDHPVLSQVPAVVRFTVSDTGHRHPAREAEDHLRGVPAGRRGHLPPLRRHRSRAGDQPRAGASAGRRDPAAQRAGQRQHVHALPAAELRRAGVGQGGSPPCGGRARAVPADRAPRAARGRSAGRPRASAARRPGAAHRRGRSALRQRAARAGAGARLQGPGGDARRRGARARAEAPADRDLARYLPARHARLDGAEPAEAGPGHAPHPGADHHRGGGAPARPRARRVRLSEQAAHHRRHRRRVRPHQAVRGRRPAAAAGRGGQPGGAAVDRRADRARRRRHRHRRHRRRGARRAARGRFRLRGAGPAPPRHVRPRAARGGPGRAAPARPADRGLHRQGAGLRTRRASCGRWPRASSSRACSRPSDCSTRPRSSCTG